MNGRSFISIIGISKTCRRRDPNDSESRPRLTSDSFFSRLLFVGVERRRARPGPGRDGGHRRRRRRRGKQTCTGRRGSKLQRARLVSRSPSIATKCTCDLPMCIDCLPA
jgi:hypothetical protein